MSHLGGHDDFIPGLAHSVHYMDLGQTITLSSPGKTLSAPQSSVQSGPDEPAVKSPPASCARNGCGPEAPPSPFPQQDPTVLAARENRGKGAALSVSRRGR